MKKTKSKLQPWLQTMGEASEPNEPKGVKESRETNEPKRMMPRGMPGNVVEGKYPARKAKSKKK